MNAQLHKIDDVEGSATCIWLDFENSEAGTSALLDTGAGISLMPKNLFDAINTSQTLELKDSDRTIRGANGNAIECFGQVKVKFKVDGIQCKQRFYVCEDDVTVLLGRDFLKDYVVSLKPAFNEIQINGKKVKVYDLKGRLINNKVALVRTYTIKPGQEVQLSTRVRGKGDPDRLVCGLEPPMTVCAHWSFSCARNSQT